MTTEEPVGPSRLTKIAIGVVLVVLLAALAGWRFIAAHREEVRREEAYQYELSHPWERYPAARAYHEAAEKLKQEEKLRDELAQHQAALVARKAKLEAVEARMEKALAAKDTAGYQKAVEEARALGVKIPN